MHEKQNIPFRSENSENNLKSHILTLNKPPVIETGAGLEKNCQKTSENICEDTSETQIYLYFCRSKAPAVASLNAKRTLYQLIDPWERNVHRGVAKRDVQK